MTMRETVEQASAPAVNRLAALPRALPFLVVLAVFVAGVFIPGWGWVFFALVLLFLLWFLYLGWPLLTTAERLMRLAVLAMITAVIVTRLFPNS